MLSDVKKMSKSMPIVKYFTIKLDKTQHVYRAGEAVKGKCHLNIEGCIQLKNLDINLICEAFVDCKQTNTKVDKKTMSSLINKYDLLKRSATDQTLEGLIAIDFCFFIPENGFPSSFNGKYGFIRYKIEAILHKDWDLFRKEVILTVTTPYNGCADEQYNPIVRMTHKKFGIYKDFIELYAKLDKGLLTPGDKVSVYCNVDNHTDHKLRLSLSLHQKQNYFSSKVKCKISNEDPFDMIEANLTCYSKRILIGIPSNIKTMSLESELLEISYQIRVAIHLLDTKESLKVELPIILTVTPKAYNCNQSVVQSLPPSYSDCQIFHRFASQDISFPAVFADKTIAKLDENKSHELVKQSKSETSLFVDMPPSYTEAVFGYKYIQSLHTE